MRPGLSQSTQLKQELKINPRLYQAMDLLYMPLLDLQQHLKQELLNNPFLDMVEPEEDEEEGEESVDENVDVEAEQKPEEEKVANDEIDWEEILLDGFDTGGRREEHEEREYYEPVTVDSRSLSDHNVEQTLDIVDRAYIMFDGQVKVSGTVRELVFDDTVADIYLGPTLTARLRARFSAAEHDKVEPFGN